MSKSRTGVGKETQQADNYTLTLSEKQLKVVYTALEWFFRLQMGQFFDYSTEISRCGYKYDKSNPENDRLFNEYIDRRNASQEMFEKAFRVAQPTICHKTQDMMIAQDVWAAIRHFLWQERPEPKPHDTTDAYPPLYISDQLPVRVEKEDEKK